MHARFGRRDPGPCPICGAAHCSCGGGPIVIAQLPARDAAARASTPPETEPATAPLGDGTDGQPFSTRTYRGKRPPLFRGKSKPSR